MKAVGIASLERRFEKPNIGDGVCPLGRQLVGVGICCRLTGRHIESSSHARLGTRRFQRPKTGSLSQVHYVRGAEKIQQALVTGCMDAFQVATECEYGRLVEQHPVGDAVAQGAGDDFDIVAETRGSITVRPTTGVFEGLRQVPVIERDEGADFRFEQGVDETAVIVDAFASSRGPRL